jgi:hypothetical protein
MHLYYDIPKALQFDGNDLKEQLRKDPAMQIDIKRDHRLPNLHGIYHDRYKPGKQTINCYYACKPGKEHVHAPPIGKWHDSIPSIPELQKECEAIARSTRTLRELPHVIDIVARARYLAEERPTKRARLDEEADNSSSLSSATPKSPAPLSTTIELLPPVVVVLSPESSPPAPAQKLPAGSNIYWDSADAKNLFNASDNETSLH